VIVSLPEPPPPDLSGDALFLDFDGTLVPLADRPEGVKIPDGLIARLHRLTDLFDGRLALVSGRALDVLDAFGFGGLSAAGSHGAEWRLADGKRRAMRRPELLDRAKAAFIAFAEGRNGIIFEDKPLGAALHFRLAPEAAEACIELAKEHSAGLYLQHGRAVVELRVPGVHKGTAINKMMESAPFAGHCPLFLGDDITDEDGFAVAAELGGRGVLVGPARKSHAAFGLPNPAAVNAWLSRILEPAA